MARQKEGILSQQSVEAMLTKHQNDWGLGPSVSEIDSALAFGHGGKYEGFTNNMIATVNEGNALIIMTSGDK